MPQNQKRSPAGGIHRRWRATKCFRRFPLNDDTALGGGGRADIVAVTAYQSQSALRVVHLLQMRRRLDQDDFERRSHAGFGQMARQDEPATAAGG
jgi:hypothetical protein